MFTYKELLNIESALLHLLQETKPHDESTQMQLWRDELCELMVKVQAAQDGFLNCQQAPKAD